MKKYYEKNKIRLNNRQNERILCCCSNYTSRRNYARHLKTNKHFRCVKQDIILYQ